MATADGPTFVRRGVLASKSVRGVSSKRTDLDHLAFGPRVLQTTIERDSRIT